MFYSIDMVNDRGNRNTWADWYLIPTSRPHVSLPEPKIKMVELPGGNGSLDLSEVLGGQVLYGMRTGSWEFIVGNANIDIQGLDDYVEAGKKFEKRKWHNIISGIPKEDERPWRDVYDSIAAFLHGRKTIFSLTDQPDLNYYGYLKVNEWRSEEKYSKIVIDYQLQPFKFPISANAEEASVSEEKGGRL